MATYRLLIAQKIGGNRALALRHPHVRGALTPEQSRFTGRSGSNRAGLDSQGVSEVLNEWGKAGVLASIYGYVSRAAFSGD